ncbi:MAG TPA: hypothetical protein VMH50_14215 [Thermoleophilia bacterium]|nr:hypothetical protein [Thermoleophilia bacterium]
MRQTMAILAVLAGACVPHPAIAPPATTYVYIHAAPARVWDAVLTGYTDAAMQILMLDRSSWFSRARRLLTPASAEQFVDCGTNMLGQRLTKVGPTVVEYTVSLRAAGDSTGVLVRMRGWGRAPATFTCVSRGVLERQFLDHLVASAGVTRP